MPRPTKAEEEFNRFYGQASLPVPPIAGGLMGADGFIGQLTEKLHGIRSSLVQEILTLRNINDRMLGEVKRDTVTAEMPTIAGPGSPQVYVLEDAINQLSQLVNTLAIEIKRTGEL